MIKGLRLGETWEYVSKKDKGDNPTIFILSTLDSENMAFIIDETTLYRIDMKRPLEGAKFRVNASARNILAVQHGLKGWKNFCDDKGEEIKFKPEIVGNSEVAPMALVRMIPIEIIAELAEEILKSNILQEEEKKN